MTILSSGTRKPPTVVAPGERGAVRIAARVVAKIAAQAAREVLGPLPEDAVPPHATVAVQYRTVRVRVHLELDYPSDIGARCAAVRRYVVERVGALVDMEVREAAVHVERLHPARTQGRA